MKCKNNLLGKAYNNPIQNGHKLARITILTSMMRSWHVSKTKYAIDQRSQFFVKQQSLYLSLKKRKQLKKIRKKKKMCKFN